MVCGHRDVAGGVCLASSLPAILTLIPDIRNIEVRADHSKIHIASKCEEKKPGNIKDNGLTMVAVTESVQERALSPDVTFMGLFPHATSQP